jgi:ribonucleoside-triphosphate reductase
VYGVTRIVGYFSKIETWNRSKVGELYDRVRTDLHEITPAPPAA